METPLQLYGGCVSRQEMFCRAEFAQRRSNY